VQQAEQNAQVDVRRAGCAHYCGSEE